MAIMGYILAAGACGRKALPTPLATVAPPVVTGLEATTDGSMAKLMWPVPKFESEDRLAGFRVYRFSEEAVEPACEDCPQRFVFAAEVPVGVSAPGDVMVYKEAVKKGWRYVYRVSCITEDGDEGEKSHAKAAVSETVH